MFESFNEFVNNEASNLNDPIAMRLRAAKAKANKKQAEPAKKEMSPAKAKKLAKLQAQRAEIMRDMEQEAEMEGGDVSDRYGAMLNKIDKQIAKLQESVVTEAYDGNMADFKYEFPDKFEDVTGNPVKAIKKMAKKGKGFEVRTSIYMSRPEMEEVGKAMNLEVVDYKKGGNVAITVYESLVTEDADIIRQEPSKDAEKLRKAVGNSRWRIDYDTADSGEYIIRYEMYKDNDAPFGLIILYYPPMNNKPYPSSKKGLFAIERWSDGTELYYGEDYKKALDAINKHKESSNESVVVEEVLCEATVEMDAMDPDNKDFLKFLAKNRVNIISKEMSGPNAQTPVITMQGKRKDLEKVLADPKLGWDDPDLAEYIEESVVNEARSIAKIQKEWGNVTAIMKDKVDAYKKAKGQEKEDLLDELKTLTITKKKLEAELDAAVGLKNIDAELVEGKVTLKRKYTENYPAITAGKQARIRNKMLEAIADGKLTQEEFNTILKEMSIDSSRWVRRNSKYFNVSEDGISLSKFGRKALNQITINENMDNFMFESFEQFNASRNEDTSNETLNERYVKTVGYNAAAERIEDLARQLDPNSRLCKGISKGADNVVPEFKEMKKHMDEIYTIWQEIEYTIDMSNESVVNEAARLRSARDWKNIGDELGFDGDKFVDDTDDGYYEVEYDGNTGFYITVYDRRDKEIDSVEFDANGMGSSEIQDEMYSIVRDLSESVVNEAARLRSARDWKNIGDELGFDGDKFVDDTDDGYYEVEYDGNTGFYITVYDRRDKEIDSVEFDANGMGSSEIQDEMYSIVRDLSESVDINEAFKSSKLRNLLNMDQSGSDRYGQKASKLAQGLYGISKIKLDELEDADLIDLTPKAAYKEASKSKDFIVFYIIDNEKENPYADKNSYRTPILRPGILAVTRGKDFLGVTYDHRASRASNDKRGQKRVYGMDPDKDGVGGNKNYRGYDASGIYNVKRAADLADRAIVFDMTLTDKSSRELVQQRADAQSGAIAFKSDKDFKKANMTRYKDILAQKASKLPLDKIVEDTINALTKHIADGIKKGETTKFGDLKLGEDKRGRDIKITDAANMMSSILSDYQRYVSAVTNAEREKEEGYSSGYYERSSKEYAKNISDRVKKVKDMDYAW